MGWRKGAYKCVQSVFFLMSIFIIFSGDITRKILRVLLTLTVLNFAYYNYMYGKIDAGTILSILESNPGEVVEFYATLDFMIAIKSILLALVFWLLAGIIQTKINLIKPKKYKFLWPFIMAFTLFMAGKISKHYKKKNLAANESLLKLVWEGSTKFLEQDVYTHYIGAFSRYLLITEQYDREITSHWKDISRTGVKSKDLYFLVIGESARKSAYGLYNQNLNTTPGLGDLAHMKIVSDPIAPAVQTRESVIRILALNNEKQVLYGYNIIDLAKTAGMETFWISNQSKVGENDSLITSFAKRSDHFTFLNNGHYRKSKTDNHLLPFIEKAISKKGNKAKLIIVHTMGSHNSFCARVWKKFITENIEDKKQCYYNSIHNSYLLLEELMNLAKKEGKSFKGIFLSDHGLVKANKSPYYVHGAGGRYSREAVEVPFMFFSDQVKDDTSEDKIIDKTYFLRDFVHTFAHWVGLSGEKIDYSKSVLSSDMMKQKNYILRSDFKVAPLK